MQINLNSAIYKTTPMQYQDFSRKLPVTKPETSLAQPIAFRGTPVIQKTVSSQILHEKTKLLRHFKDILATNVPVLSSEEKLLALLKKAHATINSIIRRQDEIEREIERIAENKLLNPQQKKDTFLKLRKESNRLTKTKLTEPEEKQPSKDNYDYALINKFKSAVLNDNFELDKIYEEHYKDLETIETVAEFKEKYPSIRVPANPKDIITDKILDTLNQKFYLDLNDLFERADADTITYCLIRYIDEYFDQLAEQFNNKSKNELLELLGPQVARKIFAIFEDLKKEEDFDLIPKTRKHDIAILSDSDKEMLDLDYDRLVISTIKQLYLEGKKLNQLEYTEGDKKINLSSIKANEYKFEKIPEKIKRLISDARKPAQLQKDYQKFTEFELKQRLNFYTNTEIGNNERIFDIIVDFDSCKFTEEDKQYLIKFLQILDDIQENKITSDEAIKIIQSNNIRPHGTAKLNEIERKELEEKIKTERQKSLALSELRQEFNNAINSLYELNLSDIAENFSKYYPESFDENALKETKRIITTIQNSLKLNDSSKIRGHILRWEIYNDCDKDSPLFKEATKYAINFDTEDNETKIGQYLLNREIIENYPESKNMFQKPKILELIMEKFGDDKNIATTSLCKYEDYLTTDKTSRQSINNILKIFDTKNPCDKILLKDIIEKDYINSDTTLKSITNSSNAEATITSRAKRDIYNKYKFPMCIDLFRAFEEALTTTAGKLGTSGIKKTDTGNKSAEHKIELKIMGYPDRLFSSKNDYKFDIYDEKGLH